MKFDEKQPPRKFKVGLDAGIEISDCGVIRLETNELVTFKTESGKAYDFVAKDWGFYATPSINGRLKDEGFKTALVQNSIGKFYIMVVERDKLPNFFKYLEEDKQVLIEWVDELGMTEKDG